jgi:NADP-dependent 3-hydroxy acid dehydrogenase YdfG
MAEGRGRLAVVSGAGGGIGAAASQALARDGYEVVGLGRRLDRLEELARAVRAAGGSMSIRCLDVRDRGACEAFAAELGTAGRHASVLVNNAGLARGREALAEGDPDDWDEMIDTNLKGLLYLTRALLPAMIAADEGHVVNIGSVGGRTAFPGGNVYCATKAAVAMLTECLNLDFHGTRLKASLVEPGMTKTDFSLVRYRGDHAKADPVYAGVEALEAEDLGEAVAWLVGAPGRVNIQDILVMPTVQRGPWLLDRKAGG